MNNSIIIVGGFIEIIELCEEIGIHITGIVDSSKNINSNGIPIIGNDDNISSWYKDFLKYKIVISPDLPLVREKLAIYYTNYGFQNKILISKFAKISKSASVGIGSVIQSGCNISSEVNIGTFVKINTHANIMHNSNIGDFTTIAPNAVVLGHVKIGKLCYIGANSTILPNVSICDNVVIGAGAVVTKNIYTPHATYVGIPASIITIKK